MADETFEKENRGWRPSAKLVGIGLVGVALLFFVTQNRKRVPIDWLFLSTMAPLWLVIVLSAVAGGLVALLLASVQRGRRDRRDDKDRKGRKGRKG
jgi:uncharacterized integral membrane protein